MEKDKAALNKVKATQVRSVCIGGCRNINRYACHAFVGCKYDSQSQGRFPVRTFCLNGSVSRNRAPHAHVHAHTQEKEISVLLKRVSVLQEEANTHGK